MISVNFFEIILGTKKFWFHEPSTIIKQTVMHAMFSKTFSTVYLIADSFGIWI